MPKLLLLTLLAHAIVASVSANLVTLSAEQKQSLLDTHNQLRSEVASGSLSGQPSAKDMTLMVWDERLAAKASEWAATCPDGHNWDSTGIEGYQQLGENIATGGSDLAYHVKQWYSEHNNYNYESNSCTEGQECGHYTQIVWAKSNLIGCALADCGESNQILVCNYAIAGNNPDERPYAKGSSASGCPPAFVLKQSGLCVARAQCNDNQQCECTLSQQQCAGESTFNSAACNCACPAGKSGATCGDDCANDPMYAQACDSIDKSQCQHFAQYCKKTCGGCSSGSGRDTNVRPAPGVVSKVPSSG